MSKILLIDDDRDILMLLERFLTKHGYEVKTASNGAQGEKAVSEFNPDLVISDYRLDDIDGAALLAKLKDIKADLPVIIITGYSDLRTAIKLVRAGAFDYMTKPLIPDEILLNVKNALSSNYTVSSNSTNAGSPTSGTGGYKRSKNYQYLLSKSNHSRNLEHQISLIAPTNYSVIIYGESGAGKEGVARMIHDQSKRKDKPFVAMDCGAISKELAASELFGHEKGSFTGALNQKIGHFEMAEGGTLFLDEIGNLPYDVQTLLLRVLQERVLRRIGANKEINIDVRVVVASNERLLEAAQNGKFREDLYHRLNEFQIDLLPLRKRQEDIMFFAKHFLMEISGDLGKNIEGFENDVEEVFLNYPWPGNVRELRNVIKRAALLSNKKNVDIRSLPFEVLNHSHIEFDSSPEPETNSSSSNYSSPRSAAPQTEPAEQAHEETDLSKPGLKKAALGAEHKVILDALTKADYNKSKAAEILGVDRKTLYNKLKKMKLLDKIKE